MTRHLATHDPLAPLYYPTSVVLVDEDPDHLHAMTMALQGDFQCFSFRCASDAVDHVRAQSLTFGASIAAATVPPLGALEHIRDPGERALHLKASRLPHVFADASRFAHSSVIVGVQATAGQIFAQALRDLPLQKLLLLDDAGSGRAAHALRARLVDAVGPTSSNGTYQTLADHLRRLQLEFFRDLTSPIEPALARADTRFLLDPAVHAAFTAFVSNHAIIEYCACMHPPGILGLDRAGTPVLMIVVDDDYRQASFEIAHAERAPTELLRRLAHGDALAVFPTRNGFYADGLAGDWRDCLWDASKLGDNGWYSAIIDEPDVARIVCGSIASFDSYRRRRMC